MGVDYRILTENKSCRVYKIIYLHSDKLLVERTKAFSFISSFILSKGSVSPLIFMYYFYGDASCLSHDSPQPQKRCMTDVDYWFFIRNIPKLVNYIMKYLRFSNTCKCILSFKHLYVSWSITGDGRRCNSESKLKHVNSFTSPKRHESKWQVNWENNRVYNKNNNSRITYTVFIWYH